MAIEDGESFRLLRNSTPEDVPAVLEEIDSLRRPRTSHILASTRRLTAEPEEGDYDANMEYIASYNGIFDVRSNFTKAS